MGFELECLLRLTNVSTTRATQHLFYILQIKNDKAMQCQSITKRKTIVYFFIKHQNSSMKKTPLRF